MQFLYGGASCDDRAVALCKGTLYLSARLYVERTLGERAVTQCLATLEDDDVQLLHGVVPVGWYSLKPILAFHRVADRLYGKGDLAMCRAIGRFSAEWQLNTFHKLILRWKSPAWMVQKAGTLWRHYHDSGRWEVEQPDERHVTGRLFDFAHVDAAFCLREQGWFERAVELTGGKHALVSEPRCRSRGDSVCEYIGTWN